MILDPVKVVRDSEKENFHKIYADPFYGTIPHEIDEAHVAFMLSTGKHEEVLKKYNYNPTKGDQRTLDLLPLSNSELMKLRHRQSFGKYEDIAGLAHEIIISNDPISYYKYINESVAGVPSDILSREIRMGTFYEDYHELLDSLVYQYKHGVENKWKVIPASLLKSIWIDNQKMGFVRNSKGLDRIVKQFVYNIKMLNIFTDISGHSTSYPEELDEYFNDEEKEEFIDWAIEAENGWRISDYGMGPLIKYAMLLEMCDTDEEKLVVCDAILNVVHQRSDLASWFVEGGSRTLSELSND